MRFFQVRDNRTLSARKQACIAQLQSILLPSDQYVLLSIPYFENIVETANESDRLRTLWLEKNPFDVYVDDDCWVNYRYEPPKDGIMRLPKYDKLGTFPDVFFIYRNGSKLFSYNFDLQKRTQWITKNVSVEMLPLFYGWPKSMMKSWIGYEFLPDDLYEHDGETMKKETQRRKQMTNQSGHVNDLTSNAIERLILAAADIIHIRDSANNAGDEYHATRAELDKMKKEMAEIAQKIKAGEVKAAKEAILETTNTETVIENANTDI